VPRAKASARQRLARRPALARASDRADDISAQRDALVAEVKRLQDALGTSARFATKAREGVNPFTGEKMMIKAKPASKKVRIRALKNLNEMVA